MDIDIDSNKQEPDVHFKELHIKRNAIRRTKFL